MPDRDSWCLMCGAAPGEGCTYANDDPAEGVRRGDPRPGLHSVRGGLFERPAVLVPDEPGRTSDG